MKMMLEVWTSGTTRRPATHMRDGSLTVDDENDFTWKLLDHTVQALHRDRSYTVIFQGFDGDEDWTVKGQLKDRFITVDKPYFMDQYLRVLQHEREDVYFNERG